MKDRNHQSTTRLPQSSSPIIIIQLLPSQLSPCALELPAVAARSQESARMEGTHGLGRANGGYWQRSASAAGKKGLSPTVIFR